MDTRFLKSCQKYLSQKILIIPKTIQRILPRNQQIRKRIQIISWYNQLFMGFKSFLKLKKNRRVKNIINIK